jgi:hypothetical protein
VAMGGCERKVRSLLGQVLVTGQLADQRVGDQLGLLFRGGEWPQAGAGERERPA